MTIKDDRQEELCQVDGTMDVQTPTDNSDDDDNEPDNIASKRQRKICAPADTVRKDMTNRDKQMYLKSNKKEKEQKLKLKQTKIKQTIPIDLHHINLKVKHLTLIKLKALKRTEERLEHMLIIGYQMICNLTGTLKRKMI